VKIPQVATLPEGTRCIDSGWRSHALTARKRIPVKLAQRLLARGRPPHLRAGAAWNGPSEPLLGRSAFQVPGFGTLERHPRLSEGQVRTLNEVNTQ
jgi:hypothetical protein